MKTLEQYKERYFNGTSTVEEEKWLKEHSDAPFFKTLKEEKEVQMDWPFDELLKQAQPKIKRKNHLQAILGIAAGLAFLIGLGAYFKLHTNTTGNSTPIAKQNVVQIPVKNIQKEPEAQPVNKTLMTQNKVPAKTLEQAVKKSETTKSITNQPSWREELNNPLSSTSRLAAVLEAGEQKELSVSDIKLLIQTLNHDENTNVRLAALEVLLDQKGYPNLQSQILESVDQQNDPVVQIQLLAALSPQEASNLKKQLLAITDDPENLQAVRDQAYAALLRTNSNF